MRFLSMLLLTELVLVSGVGASLGDSDRLAIPASSALPASDDSSLERTSVERQETVCLKKDRCRASTFDNSAGLWFRKDRMGAKRTFYKPVSGTNSPGAAAKAYDYGGRMGQYYKSLIVSKTPLEKPHFYRIKTKTIWNTGKIEFSESDVNCDPKDPENREIFEQTYNEYAKKHAWPHIYDYTWAVCKGEFFKSTNGQTYYDGDPNIVVSGGTETGKKYHIHIKSKEPVKDFRALKKVKLEFRFPDKSVDKTAFIYCTYDVPTIYVDGKMHELGGESLFRKDYTTEDKLSQWDNIWIATCIGHHYYHLGDVGND